jgi:hypothetical protein
VAQTIAIDFDEAPAGEAQARVEAEEANGGQCGDSGVRE